MDREIIVAIETICNEKSIDIADVFSAIEAALASAEKRRYKEKFGEDMDVRVEFNKEDGSYNVFRCWLVMDDESPEFESPDYQTLLSRARMQEPDIQVGDYITEPIENLSLGRISAHIAKQVIVKKIREAERHHIIHNAQDKIGTMVMGVVKRSDHSGVWVDLGGNAVGFIPRDKMIMREVVRAGERLRAYLTTVTDDSNRDAHFLLSRTAPELLVELFRMEVPEINQGLIEIVSVARDPGMRAKLAVRSLDPKLDSIGACVGMRGSRVQAVSGELMGEHIDIIKWDENPVAFAIAAMSMTANPSISVDMDEEIKSMILVVEEDKLSLAIGSGGQNVKLASRLTGWDIKVMSEQQAEEKNESDQRELCALFNEKLDVDDELAVILIQEGYADISEIAEADKADLLEIEELDEEMVNELQKRAKDVMLEMVLAGEVPDPELMDMRGMSVDLAYKLAKHKVCSVEDLAKQSNKELIDLVGIDVEYANRLIMRARREAGWFDEEKSDEASNG